MYTYITYVPGSMLSILQLLSHLILMVSLKIWFYYHPHVINKKADTLRAGTETQSFLQILPSLLIMTMNGRLFKIKILF